MEIEINQKSYNGTHSLYCLIKLGRNRYTIELRIYEEITEEEENFFEKLFKEEIRKYKDTEEDVFEFMAEIVALFEEHKEKPSYYYYLKFANIDITINNRENKIYKKEQFEHIIKILKGNNLGIYITTNKQWETIYQD
jgi:hypothetical protein